METIPINAENVAIITVLLVGLGKIIKTIPQIPNAYIPLLLALVGGIASSWLSGWDARQFIAGACFGLMAVGGHQIVTQLAPKKEEAPPPSTTPPEVPVTPPVPPVPPTPPPTPEPGEAKS